MRGIHGVGRGVTSIFRRLRGVGVLGAAAFGGIALAVKKAFDFEAARQQFKVLLGSMDAAKQRFKELQEFSARTPFQLEELIEASKTVENFSGGLLDNQKALTLTGDASAALGKNVQEITFWYSRFFALTRGGQATGEERRRLLELGVLSAEAATELKNLADANKGLDVQMGVLNREFRKFEGGMAELSTTGNGLISTLKDNWTLALATFGDAFTDIVKKDLKNLIAKLKELRTSGTITKWAETAADALRVVRDIIGDIFKGGDERAQAFRDIGNVLSAAWQDAATAAISLLVKWAPIIGLAMANSFMNLIKNIKLRRQFIKEQKRAGVSKERAAEMFRAQQEQLAELEGKRLAGLVGEQNRLIDVLKELISRRGAGAAAPGSKELPKGHIRKSDLTKGQKVDPNATIVDDQGNVLMSGRSWNGDVEPAVRELTRRRLMKWKTGGALADRPESMLKTFKGIGAGPGDILKTLEERLTARMGKTKAGKDVASTARRGLGLGELADIAQFGFKKEQKQLGTKNNPMTVQVTDDAVA